MEGYKPLLYIMFTIVSLSWTLGSIFDDDYEPKEGDGSLRCYQCNSSQSEDPGSSVCTLGNWRYANQSEKRDMIMQCPRSRSSFCHIMLGLKDTSVAIRGCYGMRYTTGKQAYIGCFYMGDEYRVCLCDSNLCNGAQVNGFGHKSWYLMVLVVLSSLCDFGLV